jgi:arylsulfatase A-like enzyme
MKNVTSLVLLMAIVSTPTWAADLNVLLIVADDLGVDVAPGYSPGTSKPPMPTLQSLQSSGVTFTNCWGNPLCSPTRATILTGKYGFRTGVQDVALASNTVGVGTNEPAISKFLNSSLSIPSAAFGKWHLARLDANAPVSAADHPIEMKMNRYAGNLEAKLKSYVDWTKTTNNTSKVETVVTSTKYATTDTVDESLGWINGQSGNWFAWVAFNASHSPFHTPPTSLHSYGPNLSTDRLKYEAMTEAMDKEMGRLINGINATAKSKTLIIFVGDNGTPSVVKSGGLRGGKLDMYEGGIRVPLVVSGPQVVSPGRTVSTLVNTADIFATIRASHGYSGGPVDSTSFWHKVRNVSGTDRLTNFSEYRNGSGPTSKYSRSVRNSQFKLIRQSTGSVMNMRTEEFYDLSNDPSESTNLLPTSNLNAAQRNNYNSLVTTLDSLSQ